VATVMNLTGALSKYNDRPVFAATRVPMPGDNDAEADVDAELRYNVTLSKHLTLVLPMSNLQFR
jgi:hypothetical protein